MDDDLMKNLKKVWILITVFPILLIIGVFALIAVVFSSASATDDMLLKQFMVVPLEDNVNYIITSRFGYRDDPLEKQAFLRDNPGANLGSKQFSQEFHNAIDVVPRSSPNVVSVADGTVVWVGYSSAGGHTIYIEHNIMGTKFQTKYLHLKEGTLIVAEGDFVNQSQVIAEYGNSGARTTGAHLHFSVQKFDPKTNSLQYIDPIAIFE